MHVLQYFTIKMQDGVVATSYANGDKFYIDPMKLLPLDRFLPKPKGSSAGITKGKIKFPCCSVPDTSSVIVASWKRPADQQGCWQVTCHVACPVVFEPID